MGGGGEREIVADVATGMKAMCDTSDKAAKSVPPAFASGSGFCTIVDACGFKADFQKASAVAWTQPSWMLKDSLHSLAQPVAPEIFSTKGACVSCIN